MEGTVPGGAKWLWMKRASREVLPTPCAPTTTILAEMDRHFLRKPWKGNSVLPSRSRVTVLSDAAMWAEILCRIIAQAGIGRNRSA